MVLLPFAGLVAYFGWPCCIVECCDGKSVIHGNLASVIVKHLDGLRVDKNYTANEFVEFL